MAKEMAQIVHININNVGIFNQGEMANINTLEVNLTTLANSGNTQIADAIKNITEAVGDSPDLTPEKREEALGLLGDLGKQAVAPQEHRSSPASLRAMAIGLATICSAAGGVAEVWTTWGPAIFDFFRLN